LIDLGVLPGYSSSSATGVSANGKVVIGVLSDSVGQDHAFRWTSSEGMTDLGVLPGGTWSRAFAASQNGAVVVGEAMTGREV
jgi:probable HAF family extracellular repeat protein